MSSFAPNFSPNFSFGAFPSKLSGESEEQFARRMQTFMQEHNFSQEQKNQWEKEKTLTFAMPKDQDALKNFLQKNPDTALTFSCRERDQIREGLQGIKDLGFLNNVNKIQIVDPQNKLQDEFSGIGLKNMLNRFFPSPQHP